MNDHLHSTSEFQSDRFPTSINWRAFEYYASLKRLFLYLKENPDAELTLESSASWRELCRWR